MKPVTASLAIALTATTAVAVLTAPAASAAETGPAAVLTATDLAPYQWGLAAVNGNAAHATATGAGTIVAVVDTGVDGTHPDLVGRVIAGVSTTTGHPVSIPAGADSDTVGHGTHVAGIIAAADNGTGVTGIAPAALLMPVRVLDSGAGDESTVAAGIQWAADHGADVVNISLGTSVRPGAVTGEKVCAAISYAVTRGSVVIVAAGNEAEAGNPVSIPANCPAALSVGAVDQTLQRSGYSSFDQSVGIVAPGTGILSTLPAEANPGLFGEETGTSMAAPHVAGAAALLRSQDDTLTPAQVVGRLQATATDVGPSGPDPEYGAGMLNAAAAVGSTGTDTRRFQPLMLDIVQHDGSVSVAWQPPPTLRLAGYRVTAFPSGQVLAETGPLQVRADVPVAAFAGTPIVQVTAITSDAVLLPASPLSWSTQSASPTGLRPVSDVHSTWTSRGLAFTFTPRDGAGTLTVRYGPYETVTRAGAGHALLRVPRDSPYRAGSGIATISDDFGVTLHRVTAQFHVAATVVRAGSGHVQVIAEVDCLHTSRARRSCGGVTGTVTDAAGRVLARSIVDDDNQFAVVITRGPRTVRVVIADATSAAIPALPRRGR